MLGSEDVDAYLAHTAIHDLESGTEGDLPYGPYSRGSPEDPAEARDKALRRWKTPVGQPDWRRAWGLWSGGGIVGVVHLAGGDLEAALHRADCGLGVQRPYRGRGAGRRLMETAIAWARQQDGIDWIDLGVFEGNEIARALYTRLGFVEYGRTPDRFRVDGLSIDDIHMALWVGQPHG